MSSFLLLIKRLFYKENTNTFNWDKILFISFALIAFGVGMYFNNQRLDKLTAQRKKNARYTVGITTKVFISKSGRDWVEYYFYFGFNKYNGRNSWNGSSFTLPKNGSKYIVEFDSTNPSNAKILFNLPVTDDLKQIPDDGWTHLPAF